jgi:hypothetical protein
MEYTVEQMIEIANQFLGSVQKAIKDNSGINTSDLANARAIGDTDKMQKQIASLAYKEWHRDLAEKCLLEVLGTANISVTHIKEIKKHDCFSIVAGLYGAKWTTTQFSRNGRKALIYIRERIANDSENYIRERITNDSENILTVAAASFVKKQLKRLKIKASRKIKDPADIVSYIFSDKKDEVCSNFYGQAIINKSERKSNIKTKKQKREEFKKNLDFLKFSASMFEHIGQWRYKQPEAYAMAKEMNVLDEVTQHMKKDGLILVGDTNVKPRKDGYRRKIANSVSSYSLDELKSAALNYKTRTEWARKDNKTYLVAARTGVLDECCSHMTQIIKKRAPNKVREFTAQELKESASLYRNATEWQRRDIRTYRAAKLTGKLDWCEKFFARDREAG